MEIGEYYWLGISLFCLGFWKLTNDIVFQLLGGLATLFVFMIIVSRMWKEHKLKQIRKKYKI